MIKFKYIFKSFTCLLVCIASNIGQLHLDDTELVLAFLIHRHGDRTPPPRLYSLSNEPEKLEELCKPYGSMQLTNAGKRRGYEIGKFIRRRYNDVLSKKFNRSEIYISSTDVLRSQMTLLASMAAVYQPGDDRWSNEINWEPTPYTIYPPKYDTNYPTEPLCPMALKKLLDALSDETLPNKIKAMYPSLLEFIERTFGGNGAPISPIIIRDLYDLCECQVSLGLPLLPALQERLPEIEEAVGVLTDLIFKDEELAMLANGPFLQDFFDAATASQAGQPTEKLRIQSSHDLNVYGFEFVTKVKNKFGSPKFGAIYILELRKSKSSGKFVVLPVYVPSPGEKEIYPKIDGCDEIPCLFDQFYNITSKYALTLENWKDKCGFNDVSVLDLHEPNFY